MPCLVAAARLPVRPFSFSLAYLVHPNTRHATHADPPVPIGMRSFEIKVRNGFRLELLSLVRRLYRSAL